MLAGALQDNWPYGYLATGSHDSVKSRGQAASHPCFEKPDISHSLSPQYKIPLIPINERELPKRILKEKPQIKTRLIHLQSLHKSLFKFLNSLPLHCQTLERQLGVLGSSQEGTNLHWLMLWSSSGIREARKKKVRRNLVGVISLEGLGALGRLGLEGLLLSIYPNYIFQWIVYRLERGREVLRRRFRFPLQ